MNREAEGVIRCAWSFSVRPAPERGRRPNGSPVGSTYRTSPPETCSAPTCATSTPLGLETQKYMNAGELVPDDVTVAMVRERLTAGADGGFILDGFPRNVEQARSLAVTLGTTGCTLDAVVEFVVPEPVLVQRLLGRGRTDDTEAVIRRRLEVYRQETAPLLHFYCDRLVSIDAVGDVEAITKRVLDALHASTDS